MPITGESAEGSSREIDTALTASKEVSTDTCAKIRSYQPPCFPRRSRRPARKTHPLCGKHQRSHRQRHLCTTLPQPRHFKRRGCQFDLENV